MLVASGTLPGAQLGVDARAHQRVDERKRAGGIENQSPRRARQRRGRLRRRRGRPSVLLETARQARRALRRPARGRYSQLASASDERAPLGLRRASSAGSAMPACSRLGAMPRRSSSLKSSRSKNGLPRVARWQAATKAGSGSADNDCAASSVIACSLRPSGLEDCDLRDHEQLVVQLLHGAGLGRHCREYERQRYACQPAGEIDQPAQGCDVRPVRVVDGHQHRLCVGQIDGQPVEPMQRRERRARLPASGSASERTGLASAAAPVNRASRSAAAEVTTTGSSSCRTIPNGNSRSSSPPRADRTRRSGAAAVRAAASRLDLPIPAGPSKTTAPPEPALAPASNRSTVSSSSSRSTSGASCTATTRF